MSAAPTASSAGRRAAMAAAAIAAALTAGLAPAAAASPAEAPAVSSATTPAASSAVPSTAGPSLAGAEAQATELATKIRVEGQQIDQLSEQADAATIHLGQVRASLASTQARAATTDKELAAARALLIEEALDAYTNGGHSGLAPVSAGDDAADPSLIGAYGEIIAGTQRDAITTYRTLRHEQTLQQAQLTAALAEARSAATQLASDRNVATAAAAGEQATLAGIQGHMAMLVAAAEAAQAQATAQQEKATLTAQGQLPPPAPAVVTATPGPPASPAPGSSAGHAAQPAPSGGSPTAPTPPTHPAVHPAPSVPTPTLPARTTPTTVAVTPPPPSASQAQTAIAYARAQLGAPYVWAGAGPYAAGFDCSGLVMRAYQAAGVSFPHLAQDQYDMTARVAIGQLQPGDLVFFGTPDNVGHVGIYVGGGDMIDAPSTGQVVRVESIYWSDLLSGGRVS